MTFEEFAKDVGVVKSTLYSKIEGKTQFTVAEASFLRDNYGLIIDFKDGEILIDYEE